jgi:glutamate/tyrosine decarboxylase-like PLP-dependent enzyme
MAAARSRSLELAMARKVDTVLFAEAQRLAIGYLKRSCERRVAPEASEINALSAFVESMPVEGLDATDVLHRLDRYGSPATVATAGGRYFGLVIGGALPVTVAAAWLAAAWDQNAVFRWTSPTAAVLEDIGLRWLGELFRLPAGFAGAFVSGASMATMAALASARHALLKRVGWDAESRGLFGAPEIKVVVGAEVHVTVLKALSILGLGRDRVIRAPVDSQGRIIPDELPELDDRTILCVQAGNVNTGSFDPAAELCDRAKKAGAWVHVDGAFGLWAMAAPRRSALAEGFENADSWATDGHKWLNVPYDCGIVLVREAVHLRSAMATTAAYLAEGAEGEREPSHFTPELSRRARGVEVWAALRSLGREGLAELIERCCCHAKRFAERLSQLGYEVLNDVVLNQVLVSFGTPSVTRAVISALQEEGVCWCGGTVWQGRTAMRISVSSWATTAEDVEISLSAMARAAEKVLLESSRI